VLSFPILRFSTPVFVPFLVFSPFGPLSHETSNRTEARLKISLFIILINLSIQLLTINTVICFSMPTNFMLMEKEERKALRVEKRNVSNALAVDRTIQVNERTLLAYLRTPLALIVSGLSFLHFTSSLYVKILS
jgi:uncharacterized membrane protein YidH (DUF202 family)